MDGPRNDRICNDEDDDEEDYAESENAKEVFLGLEDARYYNISSTLPMTAATTSYRQRRHSIGTFLNKERTGGWRNARGRMHEEQVLVEPSVMAPPIPTGESKFQDDVKANPKSRRKRSKSELNSSIDQLLFHVQRPYRKYAHFLSINVLLDHK